MKQSHKPCVECKDEGLEDGEDSEEEEYEDEDQDKVAGKRKRDSDEDVQEPAKRRVSEVKTMP